MNILAVLTFCCLDWPGIWTSPPPSPSFSLFLSWTLYLLIGKYTPCPLNFCSSIGTLAFFKAPCGEHSLPYCEVLSFIGIFIMWNYSVLILSHYFCVAWGQEYSFVFLLLGSSWLPTQYLSDDCTCVCNPFILWSWACYLCIPRSGLHTYWQWWVRLRTWRCPSENVSCLP